MILVCVCVITELKLYCCVTTAVYSAEGSGLFIGLYIFKHMFKVHIGLKIRFLKPFSQCDLFLFSFAYFFFLSLS